MYKQKINEKWKQNKCIPDKILLIYLWLYSGYLVCIPKQKSFQI